MPTHPHPHEDPRLTAYALGELDPAERADVERLLAESPEARACVAEIRELAARLTEALDREPRLTLDAGRREAIAAAASAQGEPAAEPLPMANSGRGRHSAALRGIFGGALALAAAAVAVSFFVPGSSFAPVRALPLSNMTSSSKATRPLDRHAAGADVAEARRLSEVRERLGNDFAEADDLSTIAESRDSASDRFQVAILSESTGKGQGQGAQGASQPPQSDARRARHAVRTPSGPGEVDEALSEAAEQSVEARNAASKAESQFAKALEQKAGATTAAVARLKQPALEEAEKKSFHEAAPGKADGELGGGGLGGGISVQQGAQPAPVADLSKREREVLLARRVEQLELAYRQSGRQPEQARQSIAVSPDGLTRAFVIVTGPGGAPQDGFQRQLESGLVRGDATAPGTEAYDAIVENPFASPVNEPLSTFGVDVDTASYTNVRRFLTAGQWPPRDAVRIEEMVNYFSYSYPQPADERPFSVNVELGPCPWQPGHRLVRVGLKGREIAREKRPAGNLVFLVDVSGSMADQNKLPLVRTGLALLAEQMTEGDRVAIVTYSDTAALRLPSTTGDRRQTILETINSLSAGGSTNGAAGIQLAYRTAIENFIPGGTNRVILCTDGDFNVGVTGDDELVRLIQERARSKVFFSVFGFGMGNLKDGKLEKLADKGNGHYAYVDNQREARKVFVDEMSATLVTIAKDVKVQVEFNPVQVAAWRLVGYENRVLAARDFDDDTKDAGEIGAGHTVTAIYEIVPADKTVAKAPREPLRYQTVAALTAEELGREVLAVKLRYKTPEGDSSSLLEYPIAISSEQTSRPSGEFNWAGAVAAFGMILRDSRFRGQASLDMVLELAQGARGEDPSGARQEFIDLVRAAKALRPDLAAQPAAATPAPAAESADARTSVGGKYKNLLRILRVEADAATYGEVRDWGLWSGTAYAGQADLPKGYWVYVAPNWYIWGDVAEERR